jgi:putative membrane protein
VKDFFWRWVVLTISVFVAANIRFLGISYDNWTALLVVALLLGIANTVVKPVLMLISLPLIVLSFGIFVLVLNALLFYAVGSLVRGFHVAGFWSAVGGAIVVSLVSLFLGMGRGAIRTRRGYYGPRTPPPGRGPIIDV